MKYSNSSQQQLHSFEVLNSFIKYVLYPAFLKDALPTEYHKLISKLTEGTAQDNFCMALDELQNGEYCIGLIRGLIDWLDLLVETNSEFTEHERNTVSGLLDLYRESRGKFSIARL